jgi:hypothetical protein
MLARMLARTLARAHIYFFFTAMPDVNIVPNLGKIIPFLKTQFGGKNNKTSGITVKKIL